MWDKILVVDDDIDTREKFYEIFSSLCYKVTCAPTAEEAFNRLLEERYGIIILDEVMPKIGGFEAAEKIREFDRETKIVILTEEEPAKDDNRVADLHISRLIKKDFSNHFMVKEIIEILKKVKEQKKPQLPSDYRSTVLVVDDNPQIREVLEVFLSRKGHRVITSSSGEDALMKVKVDKPRVVFLDFRMPGMDGLMVLKAIKKLDSKIDVVMLTSAKDSYIMDEARRLGASDYLVKPCDLEKVDTVITSLLVRV